MVKSIIQLFKTLDIMVYDVETLRTPDETPGKWGNPAGMGFGSAVVYGYQNDQYYFFGPEKREQCEALLDKRVVVSFNGTRFDNLVVCADPQPITTWKNIDLLDIIASAKHNTDSMEQAFEKKGKFGVLDGTLNLNAICTATLGRGKGGKGVHAPILIREARWDELFSYNLLDVRLTRFLFEHIVEHGSCADAAGTEIKIDLDIDYLKSMV